MCRQAWRWCAVMALLLVVGDIHATGQESEDAVRRTWVSQQMAIETGAEEGVRHLVLFDANGQEKSRLSIGRKALYTGYGENFALVQRDPLTRAGTVEIRTLDGGVAGGFVVDGERDFQLGASTVVIYPFGGCALGVAYELTFQSLTGQVLARSTFEKQLLINIEARGAFWLASSVHEEGGTSLHLYSAQGALVWSYRVPVERGDGSPVAAISADGSQAVIAWMKGNWMESSLVVLDAAGNTVLEKAIGAFNELSISPDGSLLLIAGSRGGLQLMQSSDGKVLWSQEASLSLLPGNAVLAGADNRSFYLVEGVANGDKEEASLRVTTVQGGGVGGVIVGRTDLADSLQPMPLGVVEMRQVQGVGLLITTPNGTWKTKQ